MKYIFLFIQILTFFATLIERRSFLFLVGRSSFSLDELPSLKILYSIITVSSHTICIIVNIILQFIYIDAIPYVVVFQVVLMIGTYVFFNTKAKKKHFERIKEIIVTDDLFYYDSREIRNYIIEEYGYVYSIGDIEKCIFKMDQ